MFEPFIGGGALFFYIMQKYKPHIASQCSSNINQNLILTYEVIRDDVEVLIQQLHIHKTNHRKDFEKFGNKKKIKIHELNKKAKKIKMYLEERKGGLLSARHSMRTAQIELNKKEKSNIFKEKFIIKIKLYLKLKLHLISFI